jgi:hypothetical protein
LASFRGGLLPGVEELRILDAFLLALLLVYGLADPEPEMADLKSSSSSSSSLLFRSSAVLLGTG